MLTDLNDAHTTLKCTHFKWLYMGMGMGISGREVAAQNKMTHVMIAYPRYTCYYITCYSMTAVFITWEFENRFYFLLWAWQRITHYLFTLFISLVIYSFYYPYNYLFNNITYVFIILVIYHHICIIYYLFNHGLKYPCF